MVRSIDKRWNFFYPDIVRLYKGLERLGLEYHNGAVSYPNLETKMFSGYTIDTDNREIKMVKRKRELINTGTDKRYVRRNEKGQFKESDDVSKSLSQDVRKRAKTVVKPSDGDKGDQKRRKTSK